MASRVIPKPTVRKDSTGCCWVGELDHITWTDTTYFDTWEQAMEHALWLGACANG